MNGQIFTTELDSLGYFSYTAIKNLEEAKKSVTEHFDTNQCLMGAFSKEEPYQYLDGRFYSCGDCEELFEERGVPKLLKNMMPLFAALNVKMEYADDSYTEVEHTISVNGRTYVMAQGSILIWGETFLRFAEMVNHELELQTINERIYLLSYDDSQYMIFLTEEQFRFVCQFILPENRPQTTTEWEVKAIDSIMSMLNGS